MLRRSPRRRHSYRRCFSRISQRHLIFPARITMKRIILTAVVGIAVFFPLAAQKKTTPAQPSVTPAAGPKAPSADTLDRAVYKMALRYGDAGVAATALYYQLAKNPTNLSLKDTLAQLYFVSRNYPLCLAFATEVVNAQPQNAQMLELMAVSHQNLNRGKEALEVYERLYPISQNVSHLYQIALLQFSLDRTSECLSTISNLLFNPKAEEVKTSMPLPNQQVQQVSLKAAAYNLRGVALKARKETALARESFQEALKLQADFALAKRNLEDLDKPAPTPQPTNPR